MSYPGGKNGAGVYQTIINLMPPHAVYIEPFLGGGAIMRLKRPAALNIGIDLDPSVISRWLLEPSPIPASSADLDFAAALAESGDCRSPNAGSGSGIRYRMKRRGTPASLAECGDTRSRCMEFRFQAGDGIAFLRSYPFTGAELVYCDPPYVHSTRSRKDLYRCEMTDAQHRALLRLVKRLPCKVMLSGYVSKLYADLLGDWTSITFQAMTRAGKPATEYLWFNFPPPVALHDYRFLGRNFRERERIKRKKERWASRLRDMPILEQQALLSALASIAVSGERTG